MDDIFDDLTASASQFIEAVADPRKSLYRKDFIRGTGFLAASAMVPSVIGSNNENLNEIEVADFEQHEEHHDTPLTDMFSLTGSAALGVALKNGLLKGHFEGNDWSSICTNLGGFLTALTIEEGSEKTAHEVQAIIRDMSILSAIIVGGAFGDKLVETKGKLGLPQTIEIPEGVVLHNEQLMGMLESMSKLIIDNAPVNIASTGAAAIIFDENLRAVTERLVFREPIAIAQQALDTLNTELEQFERKLPNTSDAINRIVNETGRLKLIFDRELQEVIPLSGKTMRPDDIKAILKQENFQEIDSLAISILTEINLKLSNGLTREESDYLTGLKGSIENIIQTNEMYKNELLDSEKWNAIGDYVQSFRSVANILGKAIGPAGDPPNAVIAIKMAIGDLDMNVAELTQMQLTGLLKNWDSLTESIIESEKRMMRVFGKNLDDQETPTRGVLIQLRSLMQEKVPGTIKRIYQAAQNIIDKDFIEGVVQMQGEDATDSNRGLIRETLGNMKGGALELYTEIARMKSRKSIELFGTTKPNNSEILETIFDLGNEELTFDSNYLRTMAADKFREKLINLEGQEHLHTSRVLMYRFLNALSKSTQEDVEQLIDLVSENNGHEIPTLVKILSSFTTDGELSTTEQDSIEEDLLRIFRDFEAGEDFLIRVSLARQIEEAKKNNGLFSRVVRRTTEPNYNLWAAIEKFDFVYSNAMLAQEIFPTVHHAFGHGTQEIASLVTLQFLAGPMVAHAFRKFIVDPEINNQVEQHGQVINFDAVIHKMLLMAATSPLSDNGLVVNVGTSILHSLYLEGTIDHAQYFSGIERIYNAAIEAGDGLPTGGPASAPFKDPAFNPSINGCDLTWSNFFANAPINGEPTQADILKNTVLFRAVQKLKDLVPSVELPNQLTQPAVSLLTGAGQLAFTAMDWINPAIITRFFTEATRKSGDKYRDDVVFPAILNLDKAIGNIQSREF